MEKKTFRPKQENERDHKGADPKDKKKPESHIGAINPGIIRNRKCGLGRIECDIFGAIKEEACKGKKPQQKKKNAPDFVDSFFFHKSLAVRV